MPRRVAVAEPMSRAVLGGRSVLLLDVARERHFGANQNLLRRRRLRALPVFDPDWGPGGFGIGGVWGVEALLVEEVQLWPKFRLSKLSIISARKCGALWNRPFKTPLRTQSSIHTSCSAHFGGPLGASARIGRACQTTTLGRSRAVSDQLGFSQMLPMTSITRLFASAATKLSNR